jgi:hypothetical protein
MRALLLTLLASTAMASAHLSPTNLADAVSHSDLIVVAERVGTRWRIVEILHARAGAPPPAEVFDLFGPHQEMDEAFAKHIKKHGYQNLPAPILPTYTSTLDDAHFAKAPRAILFLRRWKKDWQLAMEHSWEAVDLKSAVIAAIAQGRGQGDKP